MRNRAARETFGVWSGVLFKHGTARKLERARATTVDTATEDVREPENTKPKRKPEPKPLEVLVVSCRVCGDEIRLIARRGVEPDRPRMCKTCQLNEVRRLRVEERRSCTVCGRPCRDDVCSRCRVKAQPAAERVAS